MRKIMTGAVVSVLSGVALAATGLNPAFDGVFENADRQPCVHLKLAPNGSDRGFSIRLQGENGQPEERVSVGDWWKGAAVPRGAQAPYATNSVVNITSFTKGSVGVGVNLLPWYGSGGIYNPELTARNWAEWTKDYVPYAQRTFELDIETDPETGRNAYRFMGHLVGHFATTGVIAKVSYHLHETNMSVRVTFGERAKAGDSGFFPLASVSNRTSPVLPEGAAISLKAGEQTLAFGGRKVPMRVWPVAESADMGRWTKPKIGGSFGYNAECERTPYRTGPEFTQWAVPDGPWCTAWILCARLPQEGRVPDAGTRVTRFGKMSNSGVWADGHTDIAKESANVKRVGSFTFTQDGKKRTEPLYLVRHNLNVGSVLHILNDKPIYGGEWMGGVTNALAPRCTQGAKYVDLELIGSWPWNDSIPKSDVQVFGMTLEAAPFDFDIATPVRGNIFEDEPKKESGFTFTARRDGVGGALGYEIQDDEYKTLEKGEIPFSLAKAGEEKTVLKDLSKYGNGWYRLVWTVTDGDGYALCTHNAAFTVLGKNDREAGYESPYACWPQGTTWDAEKKSFPHLGRICSNPNVGEVAEMMRRAGYHSAWSVPVRAEEDSPDYPLTLSAVSNFANMDWPAFDRAAKQGSNFVDWVAARLDAAVASYREQFARYPHCDTIQLLHEQGGRDLAECVKRAEPTPVGEYRGAEGNRQVYWCTEYAKRMRREFPGKRICIGNGSSSSQMIEALCLEGFDLSLVDQLGIESKGFASMPELKANRESPGMLWALRETGRKFGYTNFTMNACNEYVFRPERQEYLSPSDSRFKRMEVTDFTLRDYILSLAWGCRTISTGHLEDCDGCYYGTNWGAGGQCTFYPYSYPKRMFTALATFTKVFDRCGPYRRIPTGEVTSYALEFARNRKVGDFASVYWTPRYDAEYRVRFPKGTKVEKVDWQGRRMVNGKWRMENENGVEVLLRVGSTPVYLVSSQSAIDVKVVHARPSLRGYRELVRFSADALEPKDDPKMVGFWPIDPVRGTFANTDVRDEELGRTVLETRLVHTATNLAEIVGEYEFLQFREPVRFDPDAVEDVALLMRGNGGFGRVYLMVADDNAVRNVKTRPGFAYSRHNIMFGFGHRGYVSYSGWTLAETENFSRPFDRHRAKDGSLRPQFIVGLMVEDCRKALDPIEMRDVEGALRFAGVYVKPKGGAAAKARDDAAGADGMKNVGDKDL